MRLILRGREGERLSRWKPVMVTLIVAVALSACREQALHKSRQPDAGETPGGLTAEQAGLVIAKVGDHSITLGEFASTLERMDQFDRLRYQTSDRKKELLDQMIAVELLANEARKVGLDKDPETAEAMRQVLRDALIKQVRQKARPPAEINDAEVRAYYDSHKQDFEEPERRRVAHLAVKDKAKAERLLAEAKKATPAQWGALFLDNSVDSPGKPYRGSMELLGDLGLVGAATDARGENPKVPAELRKAVFEIGKVGEVHDHIVQSSDGLWHIVKLLNKTDAHARSFAEAERTIRIAIAQKELSDKEKALEADLRKQFPVEIDEAALAKVKLPEESAKPNADAGSDEHHH